ncbi:ferredoxin--NADP reductase [Zavarzinia compransoris]|uniref:ferredoxin--NADP(+) reductase n=1 Tax=Zavarzinia compransoris TaxID=1264899 RepID=A0A317E6M3_9PROT|nr:ferredoxin--NADP reductase [Zavarzinia compransoris]PWR22212.1 ferredoxin--NADP(+) reductase [Zavarzinia compransoris]TDP47034.1 ferredoxin--NADP+ reductase [Zavarzinia compransoris]
MSALNTERVIEVRHWNETLFSFRTTRSPGLRFENGQFVMIGVEVEGRPLLRAYSIASANHEEHLEFFSIKVQDGKLTSRLQHLAPGAEVFVGRKPTGTLLLDDLKPGRHLYLLGTGTGLAPFMSLVKDPAAYERFEKIVVMHGVRQVSELAYRDFFERDLPDDEIFGPLAREKLVYYPLVTREEHRNRMRITEALESGRFAADTGLPKLDPANDRVMVCGSPAMLRDMQALLDGRGFTVSPHVGAAGDYVIERAFVER